MRYLPSVTWPAKTPDSTSSVVARDTYASTATKVQERNAPALAWGRRIPVVYGETTIGARIATVMLLGTDLLLLCVVSHGPIEAIGTVTLDGAALPASVQISRYLGTTDQTPDPWLVSAFSAKGITYADALPGIAYFVARIPQGASSGLPALKARVRGRLLHDPRTGTTVYSPNPALALADLMSNTVYGARRAVGEAGLVEVANADDGLVGPDGAQEARRTLGLALERPAPASRWLETLRGYAGCFVDRSESEIRLVPDAPAEPVFAFDASNIKEKSLRLSKRGLAGMPTVIRVSYSDLEATDSAGEAEAELAGVADGSVERTESDVQMPGVTRYSQARREAVERLNKLWSADLEAQWTGFDVGLRLRVGAVVTLTHPIGLAAKRFRLTSVKDKGFGIYDFQGVEYDPAVYVDAVYAAPTYADTDLPNPLAPPAVAGLALTEKVYQHQTGLYASRIAAAWTAPDYGYLAGYRVELWSGETLLAADSPTLPAWNSGPLEEGRSYTVRVAAVSKLAAGTWSSASLVAQGKQLLPGNVPSIRALEVGGEVRVTIGAATDIDLKFYELRYDDGSAEAGVGGATWASIWAAATFVDATPAASGVGGFIASKSLPVGTWRLLVCALDSVGQYSPLPAVAEVTVTLDADSFLVGDHAFTAPSLVGMAEYKIPGDPHRYFVSEDGVAAATKFPGLASSYTGIAATYHAEQESRLTTEAWDAGQELAGSWQGEIASAAVSGSKEDYISLSPDASTWSDQAGLSAKAIGRFGRVVAKTNGAATLKVALPDIRLRIDAVPKAYDGEVTTLAAGPTTITLPEACAKFKGPVVFVPEGTTPCTWTADNYQTGATPSVDLYTFDPTTGAQISRAGRWSAEII